MNLKILLSLLLLVAFGNLQLFAQIEVIENLKKEEYKKDKQMKYEEAGNFLLVSIASENYAL